MRDPLLWHLVSHAFFLITLAFCGYSKSIAAQLKEKPEPKQDKIGKTKNHMGYQNRKTASIFYEKQKPYNKNEKSAHHTEHQNWKTKIFWHEYQKTDLKNSQNCKTENPNAPLLIGLPFYCHARHKVGNSNVNPVRLKCCKTSSY